MLEFRPVSLPSISLTSVRESADNCSQDSTVADGNLKFCMILEAVLL